MPRRLDDLSGPQPAPRPSRSPPPSFVLADLTRTPPAPLLPSSFYPVSQYMGGNMAACLLTWAKQWRIHGPQSVICPLDEVELRLHNALSSFFSISAFFLVFTFSLFIGPLFVVLCHLFLNFNAWLWILKHLTFFDWTKSIMCYCLSLIFKRIIVSTMHIIIFSILVHYYLTKKW